MANLNKVMFIGRLTRDPETRTFTNGGKVTKFGFAVNNRRKNASTGQWEDEPVFLDCEVFNRGENGRQADLAEQSLQKGHQVFLEGHLKMDQWTDKEGQKRSRLVVVIDNFQFLERREGGMGEGAPRPARAVANGGPAKKPNGPAPKAPVEEDYGPPDEEQSDDIPF